MPHATKEQHTLSQLSDGDDDSGLMLAMAKQVRGTLEKKRKDSEAKFLAIAKAELAKSAAADIDEFQDALNDMTLAFDDFVMRYAAADDKIRGLWEQLLKVQKAFSDMSEKKHAKVIESDKARERGQVKAMATSKKAVEDCGRLIATLSHD